MGSSNPGRKIKKNLIAVKGVSEALLRKTKRARNCDACPVQIEEGASYFRVSYQEESKTVEFFHEDCFFDEFTHRTR
jgi:hypothetical protein